MKPQPKKEVAIETVFEYQIIFYCSPDALSDFRGFGKIVKWEGHENKY